MFICSNEQVRDHLDWKGNVSEWNKLCFLKGKRDKDELK